MAGGGGKDDLETLFARRREIDRALMEQHAREVAILFTDIVGSTQYFEKHGDIAGLELVQRHNALLFPVVAAHDGWIVKTIGDAIMAVFDRPSDAVRCAVQMQRVLAQASANSAGDPIRIRVGAHFGRALVEAGKDVFGDAVNTAARVVNEADGEQIVISAALASQLPRSEGHVLVPHGSFQPKGKAEPLPVVLVHWKDGPAPAARTNAVTPRAAASERTGPEPELFVLELQAAGSGLKVVALDGSADKGTVKAYAEVPFAGHRLDEVASQFATFMRDGGEASYVSRVAALGETLFSKALSDRARERLQQTPLQFLRLQLDDHLVHVPWELLHDGQEFLALRFAMGRVVSARAETSPSSRRAASGPGGGHALVVSNPSGDLPAAVREGEAVAGLLRDRFAGEVRHLRGPVGRKELLAALEGCAVLHFAGHAERPSQEGPGGFRLLDGVVTPEQVADAVGDAAPALVFANSCWSSGGAGFLGDEGGTDLASALLLRGTRHFVGPRWDIADADALAFALRFYERALAGGRLGEAVRDARIALRSQDHRPLSFAGYVLYGEPRERMPGARASASPQVMTRSSSGDALPVASAARRPGPRELRERQARGKVRKVLVAAGVAVVLLAAAVVAVVSTGPAGKPPEPDAQKREVPVGAADTSQGAPPRADPVPRTGPVRLSMLELKNISKDPELEFLSAGLTESMMTDFGEHRGVRLIERAQIELDLEELEFSQSKYVDPKARAELGKIAGAEVVVLGGFQRAGQVIRAHARFVDVETGEVLHALRVEQTLKKGDDGALFELQNKLSAEVRAAVPELLQRVRP